jgi:hypothetical protein
LPGPAGAPATVSDQQNLSAIAAAARGRIVWSLVFVFVLVSCAALVCLISQLCWPQQPSESISIQVQYDQSEGPIPPVSNYFGYDEPNYTYARNGKKLLAELAARPEFAARAARWL